jgi:hypothetical protein
MRCFGIMWFNRLLNKHRQQREPDAVKRGEDGRADIGQGIYYLYMIVGLQILVVFGLLGVIMFIGKVISTPGWVFMLILALFAASMVYIYRKAKAQLRRFRESFNSAAGRNYEISIMGGMLTLRIEQNPNAPKLLEAPSRTPAEAVIDAEKIGSDPAPKGVHLS